MTRFNIRLTGMAGLTLMLAGCVGPMQPSPGLAPPPTSPQAVSADMQCRQYADAQIAPLRDQTNAQTVGSTLLGAGLGAALGGAIGGGSGAAIGAASGAAVGVGAGAANAQGASMDLQQRYNMIYAGCMSGGPPPGASYPPPGYPPPGYPPPPPRY